MLPQNILSTNIPVIRFLLLWRRLQYLHYIGNEIIPSETELD